MNLNNIYTIISHTFIFSVHISKHGFIIFLHYSIWG